MRSLTFEAQKHNIDRSTAIILFYGYITWNTLVLKTPYSFYNIKTSN